MGKMPFRQWCYHKWQEHCDEVEAWTGQYPSPRYLSGEYFGKYKWCLKREYLATVQGANSVAEKQRLTQR